MLQDLGTGILYGLAGIGALTVTACALFVIGSLFTDNHPKQAVVPALKPVKPLETVKTVDELMQWANAAMEER